MSVSHNNLDKLSWDFLNSGIFLVKSTYKSIIQYHNENIHQRYKVVLWRFIIGVLPTKEQIRNLMGEGNTLCPLCLMRMEYELHLIEHYEIWRLIWFKFKAFNIKRLGLRSTIKSISTVVTGSYWVYPMNNAELRR